MAGRSRGSLLLSPRTGDDITRYLSFMREFVCAQDESLKVVLHRAGSFQEYPRSLTAAGVSSGIKGSKVKSIIQLMDFSFEDLNSDGIEIDVRTVPGSQNYKSVYVVHDAIHETDLNEEAKRYLENNTLMQVLNSFFGKEYSGGQEESSGDKERNIFVELKVLKKNFRPHSSPLDMIEKEYVAQVVAEVDKAVPPAGESISGIPPIKKHFAYVSFNLHALEYARTLTEENGKKGRQYFYISGTNRKIFGYFAALFFFREIDALTSTLSEEIRKADWLTGIWFDPLGIKDMLKTFDRLNTGRRFPLEIYVSTYKLEERRFRKKFEREAGKNRRRGAGQLKNVRGLIFDIRKF